MVRRILFAAALALVAPAIAACDNQENYEHQPALGPGFGNAVQNNMAVQIINPNPPPRAEAADYDGRRAADAVERYRTDQVVRPVPVTTSNVGIGGGTQAPAPSAPPPAGGQ